jgi:hypothetical protein
LSGFQNGLTWFDWKNEIRDWDSFPIEALARMSAIVLNLSLRGVLHSQPDLNRTEEKRKSNGWSFGRFS